MALQNNGYASPRLRKASRPLSMISENPNDSGDVKGLTAPGGVVGKGGQEGGNRSPKSPSRIPRAIPTRRKAVAPLQHPVAILLDGRYDDDHSNDVPGRKPPERVDVNVRKNRISEPTPNQPKSKWKVQNPNKSKKPANITKGNRSPRFKNSSPSDKLKSVELPTHILAPGKASHAQVSVLIDTLNSSELLDTNHNVIALKSDTKSENVQSTADYDVFHRDPSIITEHTYTSNATVIISHHLPLPTSPVITLPISFISNEQSSCTDKKNNSILDNISASSNNVINDNSEIPNYGQISHSGISENTLNTSDIFPPHSNFSYDNSKTSKTNTESLDSSLDKDNESDIVFVEESVIINAQDVDRNPFGSSEYSKSPDPNPLAPTPKNEPRSNHSHQPFSDCEYHTPQQNFKEQSFDAYCNYTNNSCSSTKTSLNRNLNFCQPSVPKLKVLRHYLSESDMTKGRKSGSGYQDTTSMIDGETLEWKKRVKRSTSLIRIPSSPQFGPRRRVSSINLSNSDEDDTGPSVEVTSQSIYSRDNSDTNTINNNNTATTLPCQQNADNERNSQSNGEPIRRISAIDQSAFSQLKFTANRLNLPTRRPSFLVWEEKYLHGNSPFKTNSKNDSNNNTIDKLDNQNDRNSNEVVDIKNAPILSGTDWKLTEEDKNRINGSLTWLRKELVDIRLQDQALARQFLGLRHAMNAFRLAVECEGHEELINEAEEDMEELRELSKLVDIPPDMLSPMSTLKHVGITRMNISSRRFSTC